MARTKSHVSLSDLPISPGIRGRAFRTRCDGTRPFFVGLARGNAQPLRTHSSTERLETARRLLSHALWMIHERSNRVVYVACFCKNHRFSTALPFPRTEAFTRHVGFRGGTRTRNFESGRHVRCAERYSILDWVKNRGNWYCSNDPIRREKRRGLIVLATL